MRLPGKVEWKKGALPETTTSSVRMWMLFNSKAASFRTKTCKTVSHREDQTTRRIWMQAVRIAKGKPQEGRVETIGRYRQPTLDMSLPSVTKSLKHRRIRVHVRIQ